MKILEIKMMLALLGVDLSLLDFSQPYRLAQSLRRAYKYDEITETAMDWAEEQGLLAHQGYNLYETEPKGTWKGEFI